MSTSNALDPQSPLARAIYDLTIVSYIIGGRRGPDLTYIADKLTHDNLVIRIVNGRNNMPAYGSSLKPGELDALVAFLETRKRLLRPQDQANGAASSSTSSSK